MNHFVRMNDAIHNLFPLHKSKLFHGISLGRIGFNMLEITFVMILKMILHREIGMKIILGFCDEMRDMFGDVVNVPPCFLVRIIHDVF